MAGAGWQLRGYLAASRAIPLLAGPMLRRRLRSGKEDPARWREKLGKPTDHRPEGRLVWMHAVGLGEVLALRGLIVAMQAVDPDLHFLVTSSTRTSAEALMRALPDRTQHQFLPLDAPRYVSAFLDHWRPDLSVWAEQDLWPNAVCMTAERGVPLALVNARMNDAARDRRERFAGLYRDVLERFSIVAAQDAGTARNLASFGAEAQVTGPLKAAAEPLPCDEAELARLRAELAGTFCWLLASSHAADEEVARQADVPGLIIAPRDASRGAEIGGALRSEQDRIAGAVPYVADTYGEMGLWYRLADVALIGGTFDETEGHSPWEAAALGCAILHGPRTGNFISDYGLLQAEGAAMEVSAEGLPDALRLDHSERIAKASAIVERARAGVRPLAKNLCRMARA